MFNGMERLLQEIRYIPKHKGNLISLGMLDQAGYIVKIESRSLRLPRAF